MKKVVILGGTGDGLVALQVLEDMASSGQSIEFAGFLNDHHEKGSKIAGFPVLGKTSDWRLLPDDYYFHFSLLSVGKMVSRVSLIESFNIPKYRVVSLIHPTVQKAKTACIGSGCLLTAYVVLQPGASLGECCSVRSGANLGHDVQVSDYVYIGPNSTLCGYCEVEKGCFIAPNAVLRDRTKMEEFSVLGAGSVALKNLPKKTTWLGNPAKRIA